MDNCVYVVHALTTDYYKIGVTQNIKRRVYDLQRTIPFFEIILVVTHYLKKNRELESRIHKRHEDNRLGDSEWFELSAKDIAELKVETGDLLESVGMERIDPSRPSRPLQHITLHDIYPTRPEREPEETVRVIKEVPAQDLECRLLAKELVALHDELHTWGLVGAHFGVNRTTVWRIVHDGYEPKNNRIRKQLGLSEIIRRKIHRNSNGRFAKTQADA